MASANRSDYIGSIDIGGPGVARVLGWLFLVLFTAGITLGNAGHALAQATPSRAPTVKLDVNALPTMEKPLAASFDPQKATNAYLSQVTGKARERSDAYFEGGYVLQFVDAAYAIAVAALLLWGRVSATIRSYAQKMARSRFLQVPIYVVPYVVLTTVLTLPLSIYEGFYREHAYGLSNQNFAQWLGDFGTSFALSLVGVVVVLTLIYAAIRATPRNWWKWGAAIAVFFLAVLVLIAPVMVNPLFNHYRPLPESSIKHEILSMAHGNGIPATNIYEFDASRQSNRISANVSGFLGTTRISITDNLLTKATPAEIKAVLGHEMGHYVLNHPALLLTWFGLFFFVGFALVNGFFHVLVDLFGSKWDVRTIDDPAGLPVLAAGASLFLLLTTPVENNIVRTVEAQADIFGLNTAREPDGFATAALKLSNYRKLDPGPLEEFIFYDHPSGRTRIAGAMRWKAEHLNDPDIKAGPVSPQ
jgi:STE24 endopeptidase